MSKSDSTAESPQPAPPVDAARSEEILRAAARLMRQQGLARTTMDQVGASAGVDRATLHRCYGSKEKLVEAIFGEVVRRLQAGDSGPWYGYGAGFRRLLAAARAFEDGYILLVRDGCQLPAYQSFAAALRARTARKLRHLLWFPERPPPRNETPALLGLALEPMISFSNNALAYWVQQGAPDRDEQYVRWCGQMMRSWRHNAAELLNLDTPEVEWPFDTENSRPLIWPG